MTTAPHSIVRRASPPAADSLSRSSHAFRRARRRALSLRVGVGAGTAVCASLGGIYGRYEFVLSGPAVLEATESAAHAEPGACVAGTEMWNRVAGEAEATVGDAGEARRLLHVRNFELPPPAPPPKLDASAVPSLLAYIPASIHRRLAARQSGWLAELRSVTALFVKLPGSATEHRWTRHCR